MGYLARSAHITKIFVVMLVPLQSANHKKLAHLI